MLHAFLLEGSFKVCEGVGVALALSATMQANLTGDLQGSGVLCLLSHRFLLPPALTLRQEGDELGSNLASPYSDRTRTEGAVLQAVSVGLGERRTAEAEEVEMLLAAVALVGQRASR